MAKTNLPPEWKALADAYGGVGRLQEAIGVPSMTLQRVAHGYVKPRKLMVNMVNRLAADKGIPSPFGPTEPTSEPSEAPPMSETDLTALSLLGECVARGLYPKPNTLDSARRNFSEQDLIRLADSDDTPVKVQVAVSYLLGLLDRN